jgi:hypothetical protein
MIFMSLFMIFLINFFIIIYRPIEMFLEFKNIIILIYYLKIYDNLIVNFINNSFFTHFMIN